MAIYSLANVLDPLAIPVKQLLSETIQLTGTGVNAEAYMGITATGTLPVPGTSEAIGIITEIRDGFATVVTEGVAIAKVAAGAVIPVGGPVHIDANGMAIEAGANKVIGFASIASTGSTAPAPQYISVKLNRQA